MGGPNGIGPANAGNAADFSLLCGVDGGAGAPANVGNAENAGQPDAVRQRENPREVADVSLLCGADLVRGATVERASDAAKELAATAQKRSGGQAFLSKIGRFLMRTASAIKNVVTFDVVWPTWLRNTVKHFDDRTQTETAGLAQTDYALPADDGSPAVAFDRHLVAAGTGFGGKIDTTTGEVGARIEVVPFDKPLYPKGGHPCLKDIVQDPKLQDCWFLSGIAALLRAKGPGAIEQLITPNADGTYDVRLGKRHFTVPFGEVKCNGDRCVSKSAPWVKILEQAVAMSMATETKREGIAYGTISKAQRLLSGGQDLAHSECYNVDVNLLKSAMVNHVPVEIGHVAGHVGVGQKIAGVMRDYISPGHAVALLDVQDRGGGKAWLTVMDPYGRTRIISSSAIKRCTFSFGCDGATLDRLSGSDISGAAANAPQDGDEDDF